MACMSKYVEFAIFVVSTLFHHVLLLGSRIYLHKLKLISEKFSNLV